MAEVARKFDPGNVVRLKSGGPAMVVEECLAADKVVAGTRDTIRTNSVKVAWFVEEHGLTLKREVFLEAVVEAVTKGTRP